ncbi:mannosyltransferase [Christiangramia portivictoriae]|uniref:mannosyltransferase n=1 Tax=Christiangramia portivictoriae TaxID=326069 RepID=UPI0004081597|nr:mannosyltransferase [Christiangramia portivictoriae]
MDLKLLRFYKIPILIALSCIAFYWTFAYTLVREDFGRLVMLYAALSFLSYKLYQLLRHNFKYLVIIAIIFRLLFLFALPELSQDYFRFIWDGQLINAGINPYQFIPSEISEELKFPNTEVLLDGMGSLSAGHYSNYPPVNQSIFAISSWLGNSSQLLTVMFLRTFIILADLGTIFFGARLLTNLGLSKDRIFLYILNPFIIIEMTGNLHFESVMVFFLVWSLYLLQQQRWLSSAIVLGLSVSVKLLPLLFLPLFLNFFLKNPKLSFAKLIGFYSLVILTLVFSFIPFYSEEVLANFMASVGLWFGKFEFNASIYYLVRWIGYQVKGYNIIETAGRILPLITIGAVLLLTFQRNHTSMQSLIKGMLLGVSVYLLLSTTVHPWYLAIPLLLSVFTSWRYMLIWSLVVILSYSAYSNADYNENLWLVALEYIVVIGYFLYELFLQKSIKPVDRVY